MIGIDMDLISRKHDRSLFDPTAQIYNKATKDILRKEELAIEYILRHFIDDPIKGDITKESLKQRCVRTILYKEPCLYDSECIQEGSNITVRMTSNLLGVVQGDFLIGVDGQRSRLSKEQKSRLALMGV